MTAADDGEVTGWYGKLPSLGDFASRRLAPSFIEPWDDWLASGLAWWREQSPDGWLDAYLASPSWRFVLMPGCLSTDATAWAGVLMPSVDRVGRYFPLTLVRRLPMLPADAQQLDALQRWLHRLDDVALDVLHDDWTVEQLEAELPRLGHWTPPSAASPSPPLAASPSPPSAASPSTPPAAPPRGVLPVPAGTIELDAAGGVAALLGAAAQQGLLDALQGHALWLSDDGAAAPTLRITRGLPRDADFPLLLTRRPTGEVANTSTHEVPHD